MHVPGLACDSLVHFFPNKTFIKNIITFFTFEMTFLFWADDLFQSLFYFQKRMKKIMLKCFFSNRKWKLHY